MEDEQKPAPTTNYISSSHTLVPCSICGLLTHGPFRDIENNNAPVCLDCESVRG